MGSLAYSGQFPSNSLILFPLACIPHTSHLSHILSSLIYMAKNQPCAKYKYVLTPQGPKILPVPEPSTSKDEEAIVDYNSGGYLPVRVKDTFKDGRYHVLRKLGSVRAVVLGFVSPPSSLGGPQNAYTLSRAHTKADSSLSFFIILCYSEKRHSALKVVKSAGRYAETARDEIKLLRKVMDANPSHAGRNHIVSFLDSFQHCAPEDIHVCLVFEPLGENLLAVIERHKATGVPVPLVKVIAKQVLLGLQYLHDECDLVHTDIKPENIMVSIPDVESHIQAELSISPPPTSRKVSVPPKQIRRPTVVIPRRATSARERHVHIFESQPLSSPLHSASSSPNTRPRLQMSRINSTQSVLNAATKDLQKGKDASAPKAGTSSKGGSGVSGDSTPELSDTSSMMASTSFATTSSVQTPPPAVSLGGLMYGMKKLSMSSADAEKTCTCLHEEVNEDGVVAENGEGGVREETEQRQQHFVNTPTVTSASNYPTPPECPITIKIADLGNATPSRKHYTEDIQTRQYRSPEAILGRSDWGYTADIWSLACVIFEMLTAEYLFDPQSQGDLFGKDDDHMAQIIELVGDFEGDVKWGGRFSREIFDSTGRGMERREGNEETPPGLLVRP
ncbi:hypothetical protein NLI96_g12507 [Meripilus lineatus]|uniref:non-specific serine/threonine protein kinase n=1 Tax=Meripilus lineatus TaxID=2056292 RepID=A0AAD5URG6_9APHY|nr:hypothetical protein NLI96_g12507 [Physisporinus lineatus]